MTFFDDGPLVNTASVATPTLTVDETVLMTDASASFVSLFASSFGADGPGGIAYALGISAPNADTGLIETLSGQSVVLSLSAGAVEGRTSVSSLLVFKVSINTLTGQVTLDQSRAVVHTADPNPLEPSAVIAANLITLTATVTDGDGDTASVTANIAGGLTFRDDNPVAPMLSLSANTVTHDETPGIDAGSQDISGGAGIVFNGAATTAAAIFAGVPAPIGNDPDVAGSGAIGYALGGGSVVTLAGGSFGNDGPAALGSVSYALSVTDGTFSGVRTTEGTDIFLYQGPGGLIVGRVGNEAIAGDTQNPNGDAAFAIAVDSTGKIAIAQYLSLKHPIFPSNYDEPLTLAANAVQVAVSFKDGDGDTATNLVGIGQSIIFEDDGPVANGDIDAVKEDGPLTADGNVLTGVGGSDINGTDGVADSAGADGITSINWAGQTGTTVAGLFGTLTVGANGSYTYLLNNTNVAVQALDDSETLPDTFTYTITDGDGDTSTATLTIAVNGTNDAPTAQNVCLWVSSDPTQQTAGSPAYPNGYPVFVPTPTDVDVENLIVTATGSIPAGVFYFNGSSYVALTTGTVLYNLASSIDLLDDIVYRPTASATDTVTTNLNLSFTDGTATIAQTITLNEVPPNRLPSQSAQVGDGSSPLTSGNSQTTNLTLTQAFVDGINANPTGAVIEVLTDFQNNPITTPVPVGERNPGVFGDSSAGSHREQEVQVELVIGTNHFAIVEDDLTAGTFEQSWFFDVTTGLMKATVNYNNIFLLDGAGNATATTLASYITTHPLTAGDNWTVSYLDNSGGPYQARSALFNFFFNDPGDPGIVVNGDAVKTDQIYGTSGVDNLNGNGGDDIILGRGGNDLINGGTGADKIDGGAGHDTMTGGADGDTFVFSVAGDSPTLALADTIIDFNENQVGEVIDLAAIFGPALAFVALQNASAVANSVTWVQSGGDTFIRADVNGNTTADLVIKLAGLHTLTAADFVL